MGFDLAAFKTAYAQDKAKATTDFLESYDPSEWSLWSMKYDYAEDNEDLGETVSFVKEFMTKSESVKDKAFGVMHVFGELEIEGIWLFQAEDAEMLFGSNEDTSWFTWSSVGPAQKVKELLTEVWVADKQYKAKEIKDTQVSS